MRGNLLYFMKEIIGVPSNSAFGRMAGVSHTAVAKWVNGAADVPYTLAKRYGLNYAWLMGDESQMWGERVRALWSDLERAQGTLGGASPSDRFRAVVSRLRGQAPEIFTKEYLSCLLRLRLDTFRLYTETAASVGQETINHLSWLTGIPVEWFAEGQRPAS